ncbi:MAG: nucleoside hydrolase [Parasporobacterium sp.]|nr:nucleoside hydrolase [Parasporobacterium sp.]
MRRRAALWRFRVIVDGDIACEFDDLFACAYALMSPKFEVVGLCAEQWGTMWSQTSMQDGYDELVKLTDAMGIEGVPICHGAENAIIENEDGTYIWESNEASDLIVAEALKEDERPLVVIVTGTMTNVAIAYLEHPEIAEKEFYIIGNSLPTGGWDFNLGNDCVATNICFDSNMEWYLNGGQGEATFKCSSTELYNHLKNTGAVGEYLWNRAMWAKGELKARIAADIEMGFVGQGLNTLELKSYYPNGEIFEFGDFYAVSRALSLGYTTFNEVDSSHLLSMVGGLDPTYVPTRKMKQCATPIDINCYLQDFFEKLEYYFGE